MNKSFAFRTVLPLVLTACCCFAALPLSAAEKSPELKVENKIVFLAKAEPKKEAVLKADMKKRLPQITQLKKQRSIGETCNGYLALAVAESSLSAEKVSQIKTLIAMENSDRLQVYQAIAKQQKTQLEKVGQRRALQLREQAPAGELFQDAKGKWVAKPEKK